MSAVAVGWIGAGAYIGAVAVVLAFMKGATRKRTPEVPDDR